MGAWRGRNESLRLFGRRVLLLGLAILAIVSFFGVLDAYRKERESADLRMRAQGQLADLSQREAQLHSDIAELRTDRGIEAALRQQYALAAQGEGLIVLVDQPEPPPAATSSSLLERIRHFFWPR